MLVDQNRYDRPPDGPRYNFRLSTSLIAAFSSAMSAYIRFKRAFSCSSAFNRCSSGTPALPYLDFHR